MKGKIFLMMAVGVLLMAIGCNRVSHNGKIDGFWRVETVELMKAGGVAERDTVFHPDGLYIAVNLELFQLRPSSYTGIMNYDEAAGRLSVDFPKNPAPLPAVFANYGILENPVTFTVEAGSKRLVLKNATTVISCRRW